MDTNEIDVFLSEFIKRVEECNNQNRIYKDIVYETEKKQNDIMHQIELGNYKDRGKWETELSHVLQERRIAKDMVDMTQPLCDWMNENKKQFNDLKQRLGKIRKAKEYRDKRAYFPRVYKDLTIKTYSKIK